MCFGGHATKSRGFVKLSGVLVFFIGFLSVKSHLVGLLFDLLFDIYCLVLLIVLSVVSQIRHCVFRRHLRGCFRCSLFPRPGHADMI